MKTHTVLLAIPSRRHVTGHGVTLYGARGSGRGQPKVPPFPHTGDGTGLSTGEDGAREWVKNRRLKRTKRADSKFLALKEECGLWPR